jgi:hypothetical protein
MSSTATITTTFTPVQGGCPCRLVRYHLLAPPLITHCCHCRYCQRESGSAFALNIWLEASNVQHLTPTDPEIIPTPSQSGKPQSMARCPQCKVCVWSNYGGYEIARFVRVGTLDDPDAFEPDIHIFTSTKLPWVDLRGCGKPVVEEYYDRKEVWSKESLERRERLIAKAKIESGREREAEKKPRDGEGEGVDEITKRTEEVKL